MRPRDKEWKGRLTKFDPKLPMHGLTYMIDAPRMLGKASLQDVTATFETEGDREWL